MLDITYAMAMIILPYIEVQCTVHKVVPIALKSSFFIKVGCAQAWRTSLKKLEEVLKHIVTIDIEENRSKWVPRESFNVTGISQKL